MIHHLLLRSYHLVLRPEQRVTPLVPPLKASSNGCLTLPNVSFALSSPRMLILRHLRHLCIMLHKVLISPSGEILSRFCLANTTRTCRNRLPGADKSDLNANKEQKFAAATGHSLKLKIRRASSRLGWTDVAWYRFISSGSALKADERVFILHGVCWICCLCSLASQTAELQHFFSPQSVFFSMFIWIFQFPRVSFVLYARR